jgi:hypothetical protein
MDRPIQKTKLPVLPMSPMRKTIQTEKKIPMSKTSQKTPLPQISKTSQKTPLPQISKTSQKTPLPQISKTSQKELPPMSKTSQIKKKTPLPEISKTSQIEKKTPLPQISKTSQTKKKTEPKLIQKKNIRDQNLSKEIKMNRMEVLPKDVKEKIINELSPSEFVKFCSSEADKSFCDKNEVWLRRFRKDFTFLASYFSDLSVDAKNRYLEVFRRVSENAEKLSKIILDSFGKFQKYLTKEYKDELYKQYYLYTMQSLEYILDQEARDRDNIEAFTSDYGLGPTRDLLPNLLNDEYFNDYWYDTIIDKTQNFNVEMMKYLGLFEYDEYSPMGSPNLPIVGRLPVGSPEFGRLPTINSLPRSPLGSPKF